MFYLVLDARWGQRFTCKYSIKVSLCCEPEHQHGFLGEHIPDRGWALLLCQCHCHLVSGCILPVRELVLFPLAHGAWKNVTPLWLGEAIRKYRRKARMAGGEANCLETPEERTFVFLPETWGWWVFYALSISLGKHPWFQACERQNSWDVKRLGEKQSRRLTAGLGLCHTWQQEKPFLPALAVQTSALSLSHCFCNQSTPFSSEHEEIFCHR